LKTKEGDQEKRYTLTIGAKLEEEPKSPDEEKRSYYVLRSSESPYFVRVNEFFGNTLVGKKREDFLAQPPTPTPAPGTSTPTTSQE